MQPMQVTLNKPFESKAKALGFMQFNDKPKQLLENRNGVWFVVYETERDQVEGSIKVTEETAYVATT